MLKTGKDKPSLAVVIWPSQDYGRRVLSGILDYDRAGFFRSINLFKGQISPEAQADFEACDGAIIVREPCEVGVMCPFPGPFVVVPRMLEESDWPSVGTDPVLVARLAAKYLMTLQLRSFATFTRKQTLSSDALRLAFGECVRQSGGTLHPLPLYRTALDPENRKIIRRWLQNLTVPCGILCDRDNASNRLVRTLNAHGLRVPEDIAVLSIGDDDLLAMITRPSLSSIKLPAERTGAIAAQMLLELLAGSKPMSQAVAPERLVTRQSTDMLAINDAVVARVVRHIRAHYASPMRVEDIARTVGIPRSSLQVRFQKAMGLSVFEEISRCRFEQARLLLTTTEEQIKRIASQVGFPDLANFNRFIHKYTGLSPRAYRQRRKQ